METSLKKSILILRKKGLSYNAISKQLNCSKGVISYHCQQNQISDIGLRRQNLTNKEIEEIRLYYKTHTIKDTAIHFNVSKTTVKRYVDKKMVLLTDEERRERNYSRVKYHRQRMKIKAVEYKGGECIRCGYNKSIRSLVFHHRNPEEKDFGIGAYANLGWEKIKKELDKCDLLCSNCHGELHEELDKI